MTQYNQNIHHRRSIRLKGYDYSQAGLYFITICVQNRECLFGNVVNGKMEFNDAGEMVESEWLKLPERFKNIELHEYIVMPNHFHAILQIEGATLVVALNDDGSFNNPDFQNNCDTPNVLKKNNGRSIKGQPQGIAPSVKTVGDMVGAFQSIVTVKYIHGVKKMNWQPFNRKLWQRNYYEHIIRDEKSYHTISNYIINNPSNWTTDKYSQLNNSGGN